MNKKMILRGLGLDFEKKLEKQFLEWSYLFVRVIVALTMLCSHGYGKLMGFSKIAPQFPDPLHLGSTLSLALVTGAEFFGAILLALGLLTRWAAFSLLFTMLIVVFVVHLSDPFQHKELAILYALFFLVFALVGGRKYSLDTLIRKKL